MVSHCINQSCAADAQCEQTAAGEVRRAAAVTAGASDCLTETQADSFNRDFY